MYGGSRPHGRLGRRRGSQGGTEDGEGPRTVRRPREAGRGEGVGQMLRATRPCGCSDLVVAHWCRCCSLDGLLEQEHQRPIQASTPQPSSSKPIQRVSGAGSAAGTYAQSRPQPSHPRPPLLLTMLPSSRRRAAGGGKRMGGLHDGRPAARLRSNRRWQAAAARVRSSWRCAGPYPASPPPCRAKGAQGKRLPGVSEL